MKSHKKIECAVCCNALFVLQGKENLRVEFLAQSVPEFVSKKAEEKPACTRERIKRRSSSEDVVPYHGLRVVTFDNKKQHIVHCGKCLGEGSEDGYIVSANLERYNEIRYFEQSSSPGS